MDDRPALAREVVACLLSYNSRTTLERTVNAVVSQRLPPNRLIIVDNASTDDTSSYLTVLERDWSHTVGLLGVKLAENLGVGAGHGIGWAIALSDPECQYVWALEHDCEPLPDCLSRLLAAAKRHHDVGAVATRLSRSVDELPGDRSLPFPPPNSRFTFNSTLFTRVAIESSGVPRSDLFCAREDYEYTATMLDAGFHTCHADAWALHATKGDHRHGVEPSVLRTYYSVRNDFRLDLESRGVKALPSIVMRVLSGSIRTLLRPHRRVQLRARWVACADALCGRMGRRDYAFLSHQSGDSGF